MCWLIRPRLQMQADQNEFETEHLVRCVDGEMRWLRTQFSIVRNDQGEPVRFLGAAQDITERKQTREALARRARELSTVADLGTQISAVLDPTQMLQTVMDLVKDSFALYHAHIYLLNETGRYPGPDLRGRRSRPPDGNAGLADPAGSGEIAGGAGCPFPPGRDRERCACG